MAYIGRGIDNISQIEVLDLITFTNSAGPYNILKDAVAFIPSTVNSLLIEVDGIIQAPASYTVDGSTITFGVSMPSTSTMNSMIHFGTGLITTPADLSVTSAKIASDAVTTAKILDNNVTVAKLPTTLDISGNTVTLPASVSGLGTGITNAQLAGSIDVTSKITGVVPTANLGSGTASSSTYLAGDQTYKALSEYNDDAIQNDIATLALHQATNANAAKYNLVNTNVDQYEDSTGVASFTDCSRVASGEYIASVYSALTPQPFYRTSSDTWDFTTAASNNGTNSAGYTFVAWLKTINGTSWDTDGSTGGALVDMATTNSNYATFVGTQYSGTVTDDAMAFHEPGHNGAVSSSTLDSTASKTDWVLMAWRHDAGSFSRTTGMQIINPASTYGTLTAMASGSGTITVFHDLANDEDAALFASPVTQARSGRGSADYSATFMNKDIAAYGYWNEPLTDAEIIALANGGELFNWTSNSGDYTSSANLIDYFKIYDSDDTTTMINSGTGTRNAVKQTGSGSWQSSGGLSLLTTAASATGNYVSTATTANASVSKVGIVITYKNQAGTNALNTDIVAQVSADGGSNYSTVTLAAAGTFSTGVLQAVANDVSVTPGTSIQYKISFANQSSGVKEARIYGASLIY